MSRRPRELLSKPGTLRAIGYVRVSTGKQALSPEAQEEKIRQMAALKGVQLVDVVVDRESAKEGSIHKRPGIARIFDLARAHQVERVIIAKLDRLTRSVVDLGELLTELDRAGVSLVSATETWMDTGSAAGRLVINIIVCVAQWEREAIAERTAAVLQHKKAHGKVYNHTPYGFERQGDNLVVAPVEQEIRARIFKEREIGLSLAEIADALNAQGVPTKIKGRWHPSTVANILKAA